MSLRKSKKKSQGCSGDEEEEEVIGKMDYKIVDYLKANTPTKRTKFLHHQVNYFYAHKAVNVLLDSQWATGDEPKFTDRQSVVCYLNWLLANKFFHRAKKIEVTDKDYKSKTLKKKRKKDEKKEEKKKSKTDDESEDNVKKETNDCDVDKNKENEVEVSKDKEEDSNEDKKDKEEKKDKDKKQKKTKIKLDMHLEQVFIDGSDAYVWMYEPMPSWYYAAGFMCLLGAVAICLFPLWPPIVRQGVYYLSVGAACFLGLILGLAVVRFILFVFIWVLSVGRHHLWILPNLTEDVGFLESFLPLYYYEYRGTDYEPKKSRKKKKKVAIVEQQEKPAPTDGADTNEENMTQTEDDNVDQHDDDVGHSDNARNSDRVEDSDNARNSDRVEDSDVVEDNAQDDSDMQEDVHEDVEEAIVRSSTDGGSNSSEEGSQQSAQSFEIVTPADLH